MEHKQDNEDKKLGGSQRAMPWVMPGIRRDDSDLAVWALRAVSCMKVSGRLKGGLTRGKKPSLTNLAQIGP